MKDQNQASFTLGVDPDQHARAGQRRRHPRHHGTWCPPTPIVSLTDPAGQAGRRCPKQPCEQAIPPQLADTADERAVAATTSRAGPRPRPRRPRAGTGRSRRRPGPPRTTSPPRSSARRRSWRARRSPSTTRRARAASATAAPDLLRRRQHLRRQGPGADLLRRCHRSSPRSPSCRCPPPDPRFLTGGRRDPVPNEVSRSAADAVGALQAAGYQVRRIRSATASPRAPSSARTSRAPRCPATRSPSPCPPARCPLHHPRPSDAGARGVSDDAADRVTAGDRAMEL